MSNTIIQNREKRKRITMRYQKQGEIVAKSYVLNFHKNKHITRQLVFYDNLSYKVLQRKIILIED